MSDEMMESEYIDEVEEMGDDEGFDPTAEELSNLDLTDEEKSVLEKIKKKHRESDYVIQLFNQLANKPSEAEVETLKAKCGEIYFISLGEKENFLFRPLKRLEWRTLMTQIQKLDDFKKAEAIVTKGIVWPQLNQQNINVLTAGAIDTLRELILQASNFMPAEYAMTLVRKL